MIRLRTLGECVIEIDGERYGPEYDVLFAGLIYLTAERGRQVPRVTLAELLWPHVAVDRRRHNLRQLLYRMRIAGVHVDGAREHVVFPERLVAPTFSAAPAPDRLVAERAAGTLRIGAFLPGYEPPFSDRFTEWVEQTRATMEGRVRRVLLEVAQAHRLRGEWAMVEALANECLLLDPLNQDATFARAEAIAMVGEKNEAVAILDRYIAELGPNGSQLQLPATVLRRRIAERFPTRRYAGPSDRCFVGRAALMEKLSTALLRARNGEGNALMLTGAPGIGKTRVVQELGKAAILQGLRVVRVGVDETDLQRPMAAFVDAVPLLRALPGALGVSPDALAFLERLTEVHRPSDPILEEPQDPRWIASRIRQSIVDLCDAIAGEGTLLLVIEDVHWLDASSWAAIAALLEWLPGKKAQIILTSRGPHPTPNTPSRCVERLAVHPVAALPPDAAMAFVRAIVKDHGGPLSDEACDWCVSVGEGNALFLRELVIHCLEGGALHAVPPSLKGLLDARIARLGPIARRMLEAVAVLGDYATFDRLESMLALTAHELLSALSDLVEALLIDPGSVSLRVLHELVSARVLSGISGPVLQLLHRRAAVACATEPASDASAELLQAAAHHWQLAREPSKAAASLLAAADAVMRIGAGGSAVALLETACAIESDPQARTPIRRRLARQLMLDSQWAGAVRVCEAIQSEATYGDNRDEFCDDTLLRLQAAYLNHAEPIGLWNAALELASCTRNASRHRVAAARLAARVALMHGTETDRQMAWRLAEPLLNESTDSPIAVLELAILHEVHNGSISRAIEHALALKRSAHETAEPIVQLAALLTVADTYRAAGLWNECIAANQELLTEATRRNSAHFELRATERIASSLIEGCRSTTGVPWLNRAMALAEACDNQWYPQSFLEERALLELLNGQPDLAYALALRLRDLTSETRHCTHWHRRAAATLLAQVHLHLSEGPIPDALLHELEREHRLTWHLPGHDRTAAALAVALARCDRTQESRHRLHEFCALNRRETVPFLGAETLLGLD